MHFAAGWFKPSNEVVEFLSKHGDINAVDNDGSTSLHLAAELGNIQIVRILLANGANPSLQNKAGETPIDLAEDQEIRKLLKKEEEKAKMPVNNGEANLLLESNKDKTPEKEQSKKVTDSFIQDDSEKSNQKIQLQ